MTISAASVAQGVAIVMISAAAAGAAQSPRVWPSPPEAARIRFVRAVDPASARGRPSVMARVVRALVGGRDTPRMLQPYGVAVGADGRLYVADTTGRALHVYTLDRAGYSTIKVDGASLIGVAVVGPRIFVTDSASARLMCLDARGHAVWTLGTRDGFQRPTGIVAGDDRLYVVDTLQHRVVVVALTGTIIGSFGSHGAANGQFNFPTNIARGADGRLYVADTMNFRVQIFDREGRFLRAFGHLGDGSGDFARAKGIGVDRDNHVYVVDGINDVVQVFDDEGQLLLAFGESGAGEGQFWLPTGLTIANNVVYVADSANRRVELFEYLPGQ